MGDGGPDAGSVLEAGPIPDSGSVIVDAANDASDGSIFCTTSNLVGTWQAAYTGNSAWTATFHADGTYTASIVAAGAGNAVDAEELAGTYTVDNSIVTQSPTTSSCAALSAVVWGCAVVDSVLVVVMNGQTYLFAPAQAPSLSGDVTGCFADDNGTLLFTPRPYGSDSGTSGADASDSGDSNVNRGDASLDAGGDASPDGALDASSDSGADAE
jgi:hypothetical protein